MEATEQSQIKAAARRALMAANPDYFGWSPEQQEVFRAKMDYLAQNKIEQVLINDILDIQCKLEDVDDIWNDATKDQIDRLNLAKLFTCGIGTDFIFLIEFLDDDVSLLDFPTLYDYDYDNYLFQKQSREKEGDNDSLRDYYAFRWPPWIKLLIDENFHYATLTSLATYIMDQTEVAGNKFIDKLIPNRLIPGKNHGKPEKDGVLWDMRYDAGGHEKQLAELKRRWYRYQDDQWLRLSQEANELTPAVFIRDNENKDDPMRFFIFTNEAALKLVRWRYFIADTELLIADDGLFKSMLKKQTDQAITFLKDNYQDILKNFNPDNVVEFRKKSKIILTPQFLDK